MFAGGAGGLISCPGLKSASTRAFDPWSDACDEPSEKYRAYCRKGHGLEKSDDLRALLCERKPRIYRFKDDGVVPNHPLWPLVIYKSAVRLPECLDPAAVFEELFDSRGWGNAWRDSIYDYVHYHSTIHEVLGIARGSARVSSEERKGARSTSGQEM
jgi:hypothetical protein